MDKIEHMRTALDYISNGIQCSRDLDETKVYIHSLTTALENMLDMIQELQEVQEQALRGEKLDIDIKIPQALIDELEQSGYVAFNGLKEGEYYDISDAEGHSFYNPYKLIAIIKEGKTVVFLDKHEDVK